MGVLVFDTSLFNRVMVMMPAVVVAVCKFVGVNVFCCDGVWVAWCEVFERVVVLVCEVEIGADGVGDGEEVATCVGVAVLECVCGLDTVAVGGAVVVGEGDTVGDDVA